jgi:putative tryptophan/tyrosine transport system substrate-binding protein
MHETIDKGKTAIIWAITVSLLLMTLIGCRSHEKIFTIGIVNDVSSHCPIIEGFKEGMEELGYIEGKNVMYIYNGLLANNDQIIDAEIKKLLDQGVSLILTTSNKTALAVKNAVDGTDAPVLAAACALPVETGLMKSLSHPGGNVTGVQVADTVTKGLEWLMIVTPHAKKIYLPYNPDDTISVLYLNSLNKSASRLGIELVLHKVHSVEESVAAIKSLPEDVDAIYRIPSPTLGPRNIELSQAAIKRGLPMGSGSLLDEDVLITFASDLNKIGKQAARLAQQIHQGIKPADLPMETSEPYLIINLKMAKKVRLTIPDDILAQAKKIIR